MGKDIITLQNEIKAVTHEIEDLNTKKKALSKLWQLQVKELDKKYET
jgi:seryl-tRNA synthetase